ncbi:TetR/AcrR family transcriptional regulator [Nocardia arizonensis]|uniref:TetR/AcrR family transcriptional regulator n=1 Tax=Nocardia arizonensis TaxID=1141647 RepID=UPI0006D151FB|nr:TetR/AcrR family transcriptional regulator [Nocardia arizonensis]
MVRDDWVVGDSRRVAAAERIHAAATDLILTHGLDAFDIETLARAVHCSRATIYRYAGGKAQIRDAVLMRLASDIVDTVREAVDGLSGAERVVTAISVALEQIRSNPLHPTMPNSRAMDLDRMHTSPLLSGLAAELTGITDHDPDAAQWIVRVVLSFAQWPLPDNDIEQHMIRNYVAPAFTP